MSVGEGEGETCHDVRERGRRHVRRIRLSSDPRSVKLARDEVAGVLQSMGWSEHSVDKARVVTSELVTNALLHTRTPVEMTVRVDHSCFIEVSDGAPADLPQLADQGDPRPGGMGLYLIDALSAEWGVERDPTRKVVWARLAPGEPEPETLAG